MVSYSLPCTYHVQKYLTLYNPCSCLFFDAFMVSYSLPCTYHVQKYLTLYNPCSIIDPYTDKPELLYIYTFSSSSVVSSGGVMVTSIRSMRFFMTSSTLKWIFSKSASSFSLGSLSIISITKPPSES